MSDIDIIEKTICFEGFFRIERYRLRHRLFKGGWSDVITREMFERGHASAVLPYDPVRDEVVLIEQFRIGAMEAPTGAWLLEIVAGVIDEGESSEEVAKRECIEEAGCIVSDLIPICDYLVSPGGTSEQISLFCGKVDSSDVGGIYGLDEEHEDIKVTAVPFEQAFAMIESGKINSASPIMALQWLMLNHARIRALWGG